MFHRVSKYVMSWSSFLSYPCVFKISSLKFHYFFVSYQKMHAHTHMLEDKCSLSDNYAHDVFCVFYLNTFLFT